MWEIWVASLVVLPKPTIDYQHVLSVTHGQLRTHRPLLIFACGANHLRPHIPVICALTRSNPHRGRVALTFPVRALTRSSARSGVGGGVGVHGGGVGLVLLDFEGRVCDGKLVMGHSHWPSV